MVGWGLAVPELLSWANVAVFLRRHIWPGFVLPALAGIWESGPTQALLPASGCVEFASRPISQSEHHSQAWGQCRKGLSNGVMRQKTGVTYYLHEVIYGRTAWVLQNYTVGNTFLGSTISKLKKKNSTPILLHPLYPTSPPFPRSNHSWVSWYLSSIETNIYVDICKKMHSIPFCTVAHGT